MVQNDKDLLSAVFDASEFLADVLARYARIEIYYRDSPSGDLGRLEGAIIRVYSAILNYAVAVMDANTANTASKGFLRALNRSLD
jgi:hypothetical protein